VPLLPLRSKSGSGKEQTSEGRGFKENQGFALMQIFDLRKIPPNPLCPFEKAPAENTRTQKA